MMVKTKVQICELRSHQRRKKCRSHESPRSCGVFFSLHHKTQKSNLKKKQLSQRSNPCKYNFSFQSAPHTYTPPPNSPHLADVLPDRRTVLPDSRTSRQTYFQTDVLPDRRTSRQTYFQTDVPPDRRTSHGITINAVMCRCVDVLMC